ncbi:hypothetical protein [Paenibacillus dendritiformis]|nr:hypothetical protein [Paenibacillus dendritiformis]
MSRTMQFLRYDLLHMGRDPMMLFIVTAPALLIAAMAYGVPWTAALLERRAGIHLMEHAGILSGIGLLLIPLVIGVMAGLLMLDERDERVLHYYAATPLRKSGYLLRRMVVPLALAGLYLALAAVSIGWMPLSPAAVLGAMPMLMLEVPLMALFLTGCASNKVEGLALSKLGGIAVFLPVLAYVLPASWWPAFAWLPTYWVAHLFTAEPAAGFPLTEPWGTTGSIAWGIVLHVLCLALAYKRYRNRAEE